MFDDQNNNQVEDIFAGTDANAQKPIPVPRPPSAAGSEPPVHAVMPDASYGGPPSALSQGKLKPAAAEQNVPSGQVSASARAKPVKGILLAVSLVIFTGAAAFGGYWLWQNWPQIAPADPDALPITAGSAETDRPAVAPAQTAENIAPAPSNTNAQSDEVIVDGKRRTFQDQVLDPFGMDQGAASRPLSEIDSDQDGLTDAEEARLGTNPYLFDTDNDGLSDWEEVTIFGTDPLDPDTDKDGFPDGLEVQNGYNPKGPGKLLDFESPMENTNK